MRNSILAAAGALFFSYSLPAQTPFDSHDLTGTWTRSNRVLTMSNETPPMTAWGKAKFDAAKPVYGPRAVAGGLGNDPMMTCDPVGMPRYLFLEVSIYPMEFIRTSKRVLQHFEWGNVYRQIWVDGRELPKDPEPAWMGYSVGRWEGDTFVVNSVGFDERTWLDHFGNPVSDQARLEERYRRVDRDTLELTITLTDPKAYTKTWVSEKKIFKLDPKHEIQELFCVPSENDAFNKRVRDPGAGIIHK
jgi:hypothetical protein